MARLKIAAVCGMGMGTCFLAKMTIEKLVKKLGCEASVNAVDVGSAAGIDADIFVTTEDLTKVLRVPPNKDLVVVTNLVSEAEMENKLTPILMKLAKSQ